MDWRTRVRELRTARSLLQADLAKKIPSAQPGRLKNPKEDYVSQSTISDWERGGGSPTVEQLHALALALGVSVAELIGEARESEVVAPPGEAA